jgi:hypothetical protein
LIVEWCFATVPVLTVVVFTVLLATVLACAPATLVVAAIATAMAMTLNMNFLRCLTLQPATVAGLFLRLVD